jgi:predicted ribosome quality control (RQC) complex YloA/Tae2 family protein
MYVDAITLAAVADELRFLLIGARIESIIPPTEHAIALECYAPARQEATGRHHWLMISAHPQLARLHLTLRKPPRVVPEPPPFVMLLRKYLEGGRIEEIEQPRWERVLHLLVSARAPAVGDETPDTFIRLRLIAEIMGRTSNIILCDERGMILGSHKRVDATINRYRVILPNVPYVPPPSQQRLLAGQQLPRLEPTKVTAAQLAVIPGNEELPADAAARRREQAPRLWQLLVRHLLGFSPLLAREAVYRAFGESEIELHPSKGLQPDEVPWEQLAASVRQLAELYDTHRWQPQLVERVESEAAAAGEQRQSVPIAFAPYALEQYAAVPEMRVRTSPSINVLIAEFYAHSEWYDALENLRAPLRRLLQTQIERCRRRAAALQEEQKALAEAEQYRRQAELLLTFQNQVPRGATQVRLPNLFADTEEDQGAEVSIALDPRFDAVENANRLFAKYHKIQRAAALLPEQSERNAVELATLEQFLTDLALAETPEEIRLVEAEIQAAGYLRRPVGAERARRAKGGKAGKGKATAQAGGVPLHVQSRDGFTILIGRNSRQNEEVTFRQATSNDIWLHARGVPGAHVVIKTAGRQVPAGTLEQAAGLAAYYSQARGNSSVPVDYTLQRYVRRMKGGGPGMVIYDHERTLQVRPLAHT